MIYYAQEKLIEAIEYHSLMRIKCLEKDFKKAMWHASIATELMVINNNKTYTLTPLEYKRFKKMDCSLTKLFLLKIKSFLHKNK